MISNAHTKEKVKSLLLTELAKDNWSARIIEDLVTGMTAEKRRERIAGRVSDELPRIAATICGVTVPDMMSGWRKGEVILALQFVYKELYERHSVSYHAIASRFNRKYHQCVMSGIAHLNGRLETGDEETLSLHNRFRDQVEELTEMLSL